MLGNAGKFPSNIADITHHDSTRMFLLGTLPSNIAGQDADTLGPPTASTGCSQAVGQEPAAVVELQLTATAVVAIQLQLLTCGFITNISRTIISISIMLELSGLLLTVCLEQARYSRCIHLCRFFVCLASQVPAVMILAGIVGLGVALVLETFETSLGAAVTMTGLLAFGVVVCLSVLLCGLGRREKRGFEAAPMP